ncbi:MAG: type II secretion system protein GspD, partial [Pseudomonadota bacterium]
VAEPQTNSILINAPADQIDSLANSVRALDQKPAQVLIEAVIFEISSDDFSDLSVQFGAIIDDAFGGGTSFSLDGRASLITLVSSAIAGNITSPGDGAFLGAYQDDFAGLVTALAGESTTRLLSTPAVLTLNNQEAEIVVAQNVPFVTGSFSTVGDSAVPEQPFQTIERQDVGLTLKVRPQITDDNMVRMAISQEVSNLTGTAAQAGEITTRRNLTSNVLVSNGRVIMLGGLMGENGQTNNQRVPGLSNVPVLGGLFRGRNYSDGQRVLLVMLRPRVLRSDREAQRVTSEIARRVEEISRQIEPRSLNVRPDQRRTGFPFDGVDLNQPFDRTYVDKAVRERLYPALPPRLNTDVGQ